MGRLVPNDLPTGKKADICKGTDRPNEGSITQWAHQSRPGVSGRDDHGRPSGPILCYIIIMFFFLRLVTQSSQYTTATDLIEI